VITRLEECDVCDGEVPSFGDLKKAKEQFKLIVVFIDNLPKGYKSKPEGTKLSRLLKFRGKQDAGWIKEYGSYIAIYFTKGSKEWKDRIVGYLKESPVCGVWWSPAGFNRGDKTCFKGEINECR
jgi:hypothetical protein